MSKLNEFISQVKTEGLMGTNRYSVEFALPSIIGTFPGIQKILLHSESLNLPGINISTTQARTFGEYREMPYEKTFEPVQMTFLADNGMMVKQLFDTWTNNAVQNMITRKFNYYNEYTTDMVINVFDKSEKQRYQVTLYECYPKNIASVQMDNNFKGEPMRVIVSMNYKYWDSSIVSEVATGNKQEPFINTIEVPQSYYTNFNAYQAGFNNSFENVRTTLYAIEDQVTGFGTSFT